MAPLHNKAFRHSFPFLSHPCPEEQSQQACSGAERRLSEPSIAHGVTIDEFPGHPARITDFFSSDTFNRVLHDPAVSNQFYLFSKAQNCAENVHFIRKVENYYTLLRQITDLVQDMNQSFAGPDAPQPLNLNSATLKQMGESLEALLRTLIPSMGTIFRDAKQFIEQTLITDIYPRFVKHQLTLSAENGLSMKGLRTQGWHYNESDNPISFASDRFLKVTGYSRSEVIRKNCRFLQGKNVDQIASRRVSAAVRKEMESVELLLNQRKTRELFWNLLYVTPLLNSNGRVQFFLGAQIDCSSAIPDCSDIMKILLLPSRVESSCSCTPVVSPLEQHERSKASGFFNNFINVLCPCRLHPTHQEHSTGMESDLVEKMKALNFESQSTMFRTAYSKYLVIRNSTLHIEYFSTGLVDMLATNNSDGRRSITQSDVFEYLSRHSTSIPKDFEHRVRHALAAGRAISLELDIPLKGKEAGYQSVLTHWTPMKDQSGQMGWVVVSLASAI